MKLVVARVPQTIGVGILLAGIEIVRAIVIGVDNAVVVVIPKRGLGGKRGRIDGRLNDLDRGAIGRCSFGGVRRNTIGEIGNFVIVRIPVVWVGADLNFKGIGQTIPITIDITEISDLVSVQVGLVGVWKVETVVIGVGDTVIIKVIFANVANPIVIGIFLDEICRKRAVVDRIVDCVEVTVGGQGFPFDQERGRHGKDKGYKGYQLPHKSPLQYRSSYRKEPLKVARF